MRDKLKDDVSEGASLQNEKKRKNALTEVLRFICQQEYPVTLEAKPKSEDDLYNKALSLALNGDVKQAVTYLSTNGKRHMA